MTRTYVQRSTCAARRTAIIAGVIALSGCVAAGPEGPDLPQDYVPGADYTSGAPECKAKGGEMIVDGNGVEFCSSL